jgi:hypothetical protein
MCISLQDLHVSLTEMNVFHSHALTMVHVLMVVMDLNAIVCLGILVSILGNQTFRLAYTKNKDRIG